MDPAPSEEAPRELDFHPAMDMRWEITSGSGEFFGSVNWLDPGLEGPPVHVHPNAEESFEVLEGALEVCVDGEWRTIGPGETAIRRAFRTRCGTAISSPRP